MLYKKVMRALKARIDSEEFHLGDNLPTEKDLMVTYSVSRITIRKAVDELVALGMIEKRQGSGSTVIGKTRSGSMSNLLSANEYMVEYGVSLEYKVDEFRLIEPDDEVASTLGLSLGEKIYFIRRYKMINGVAAIYEDSYMPVSLFPQMNIMSLQGSKYNYLEKDLGFEIDGAFQDFVAILPSNHMCEVLGLASGIPVIQLLSVGKLKDGQTFEYTKICFKPDTYSYQHYLKRCVGDKNLGHIIRHVMPKKVIDNEST